MKVFLFFLIFLGIVLLLGYCFKKKILFYFCRFLKKKTGFSILISDIGLSLKGITFKQVTLTKASFQVEIDLIGLGLALNRQFLSLHLGNVNCYYPTSSTAATNYHNTNTEQTATPALKKALDKITNLLIKRDPKIRRYTLIKVHNFCVFYRDNNRPILSVGHLIVQKQKITFELNNLASLQSKYKIIAWFKPYKILYTISHLFTNQTDLLQTNCLKGKIAIIPHQQFTISAYASTVILNHKKIANQPLTLKQLNISLIIDQFEDRLELNPDSSFQFNHIILEMKGRYSYQEDLCSLLLYLTAQVEELIALLPNLQVKPLSNFKSEGEVCVGCSLGFLWSDPLHYKFDLDYNLDDFKIIDPGIDLSYLQNNFSFKSTINPANHRQLNIVQSNFNTEDQHLLSKIIQLAEDPNFYQHNGIDSYFVGVAIANNLARKQFFKGASTLSMQLVKNLFLGEEKSLARKLEELILTLLMENYFNIPKERILAIYLQVIELGPEVYGIHEAAMFYFHKTVMELSLLECLVISYIIPRPRFFLAALIAKSEQLDQNLSKHIESKLKMLVGKQMINKDELLAIDQKIAFYNIGEFELSQFHIDNIMPFFAYSGK